MHVGQSDRPCALKSLLWLRLTRDNSEFSPYVLILSLLLQSFASGFLFGEVLARCNLQPDFEQFADKNTPDARINNFTRLQVRATTSRLALPSLPLAVTRTRSGMARRNSLPPNVGREHHTSEGRHTSFVATASSLVARSLTSPSPLLSAPYPRFPASLPCRRSPRWPSWGYSWTRAQ